MTERPILFSGPMVRAILEGRKTQTRRVMKGQPFISSPVFDFDDEVAEFYHADKCVRRVNCPYGKTSDLIWVRECWSLQLISAFSTDKGYDSDYVISYRAGGEDKEINVSPGEQDPYLRLYDNQRGDWRPSIHMPRWASRITLEITAIRVERLNEISEADAVAEGANPYAEGFRELWESINGAGSWAANPWVWVIEFKRVAP